MKWAGDSSAPRPHSLDRVSHKSTSHFGEFRTGSMSTSHAIKKLVQHSTVLKRGAEAARQEIFGHLPQLNIQSGHQKAKVSFTGPYLAKYYPESINKFARKVGGESLSCCFRCYDPTDSPCRLLVFLFLGS
jgi:hypothetical protein